MTGNGRPLQSKVRLASASRIVCLTKPDFKFAAQRLFRKRKKSGVKPRKPKRVRYWKSRKPV
jgi:hypothetical protein